MVSHTLILSKIVGTVSLGALAGTLATSTNVSLPLLLLTSPKDAGEYLKALTTKTAAIVKPLSIAAFGSLAISFFAAGPAGRHPYLLYSALAIPITYAVGYFKGLPVYSSLASILTPSPAPAPEAPAEEPTKAPVTEVEHSSLDNSIYNNISKSDLESSEDETSPELVKKSPVAATDAVDSPSTEDISPLVQKLVKYGRIATGVTSTAFLVVTVGIYGDMY